MAPLSLYGIIFPYTHEGLPMKVQSSPFAKLFTFENNQQLAAYIDPTPGTTQIKIVISAAGVVANSNVGINYVEDAETRQKIQEHFLNHIDEKNAREFVESIESSIQKNLPVLSIIRDVHQIIDGPTPPVARFAENEQGEKALLVRGEEDGDFFVNVITASNTSTFNYSDSYERDKTFAGYKVANKGIETAKAETSTEAPKRRKPGP